MRHCIDAGRFDLPIGSSTVLVMEILAIGFLLGGLLGWGVPSTIVHQDCKKGDQAACSVDKKINYQPSK